MNLREVSQAVHSTFDLETVLAMIIATAVQLSNRAVPTIWLAVSVRLTAIFTMSRSISRLDRGAFVFAHHIFVSKIPFYDQRDTHSVVIFLFRR
jgi:hypothetical protein